PLAMRVWRQSGWRGLAPLVLAGSLVIALVYIPFWAGLQTFAPIWHQTAGLGWSLATILTVAVSPRGNAALATVVRSVLAVAWAHSAGHSPQHGSGHSSTRLLARSCCLSRRPLRR